MIPPTLSTDFHKHFEEHKKTLSQISYDDDNKVSLCSSDNEFLSYDSIVDSVYGKEDTLCSPDLIEFSENTVIFVEFKNGSLDAQQKRRELKLKGIEGCYLAFYRAIKEFDSTASFEEVFNMRKSYVIVYNTEKSKPPSRTAAIRTHLSNSNIRFGLDNYKGTFFHNIQTISPEVFMEKVLPKFQGSSMGSG